MSTHGTQLILCSRMPKTTLNHYFSFYCWQLAHSRFCNTRYLQRVIYWPFAVSVLSTSKCGSVGSQLAVIMYDRKSVLKPIDTCKHKTPERNANVIFNNGEEKLQLFPTILEKTYLH